MSATQKSFFRPDINGLRAWAVIIVILYHFGIPGFSGGFVGVDVFFVISGYLMTRIIITQLENSRFQLGAFYLARARRIIPALVILCFFLMIAGWFFLTPIDYKQLGYHVMASLLFFSNHKFLGEAGYFDTASHEKWLLHTWSLSLEWQFYLALPLILLMVWRFLPKRSAIFVITVLLFFSSLIFSIIQTDSAPSAAFYLLTTRAWELLAGGIIFLLMRNRTLPATIARLSELIGFSLIIASTFLLSAKTPWPGTFAILPVTGAALVLIAARSSSHFTNSRVAQWLGDCSYSLYLWHWPFVVALVYIEKQQNTLAISLGLALTLLFGWLSYRFVETPFRLQNSNKNSKPLGKVLLIGTLIAVSFAGVIRVQDGFFQRLPEHVKIIAAGALDKNPRIKECHSDSFPIPECTYGGDQLGAIVIGDSHAASIMRTVEIALPYKSLHVLDWSMSACPTAIGVKIPPNRGSQACPEFIKYSVKQHHNLPKAAPMIILNRGSIYAFGAQNKNSGLLAIYFGDAPISVKAQNPEHLAQYHNSIIKTACEFARTRPVYILRPIPEMPAHAPSTIARGLMYQNKVRDVSISLDEYHRRHAFIWEVQDAAAASCNVKILNPLPYLCWDGRCHSMKNGRPMYYDDNHLSEYGARQLLPILEPIFTTLHQSRSTHE